MDMNRWRLIYHGFDPATERLREALCTLGNGYFATRGAAPEQSADEVHYPGTYLACGYNRLETELAGRIVENEDLVNLPNWLPVRFRIGDGDWFDLRRVKVLDYRLELDLQEGTLHRRIRFEDDQQRRTTLVSRRLVSMANPHLAALETVWRAENWSGPLEIQVALDGRVTNDGVARYRQLNGRHLVPIQGEAVRDDTLFLKVQTSQSELRVAQAARSCLWTGDQRWVGDVQREAAPGYIAQRFVVEAVVGVGIRLEKVVALYTSRDHAISECGLAAMQAVTHAGDFASLQQAHAGAWTRLWSRFEIELDLGSGAEAEAGNRTALVLNLHIFHLLQTSSPHTIDLDVGVPSRGWHGEAYRGHIFWDEMFVFPLLNFRIPDITRSLMLYRYRRLGAARQAARDAGYAGAMFPWQSGSDGREETQVVHLNPKSGRWLPDHSHLQRHVNFSICFNIWQYFQISGDLEFICFHGAEMFFEIARFWASLTSWNPDLERYEICGVMGPDEYHDASPGTAEPGLRNNSYTNLGVVWLLCRALDLIQRLPAEHVRRVRHKLQLLDSEIEHWDDISRKMRLFFHPDGILSQFEGYADLAEFEWDFYRERHGNILRLDRILEAEGDTPNRYKLSKQADVLMLFYLFSVEELARLFERLGYSFDPDQLPRTADYYLHRTSHGSTLSQVVHSWVLARSDRTRSWQLFNQALESDVADVQGGTTPEGIHLGAMAGTVDLVQRCYTGMEARDEVLWFNPRLPEELTRLRLRIRYHQASIQLDVTHSQLRIQVLHCPCPPVRIGYQGQVLEAKEKDILHFALKPPPREAVGRAGEATRGEV
jgi:alpha,alpha-trehalase